MGLEAKLNVLRKRTKSIWSDIVDWMRQDGVRNWLVVIISIIGAIFLYQQNAIMDEQSAINQQQTEILKNQNQLVEKQNKLIDRQVKRIDQQTNLQEAERRSSIVYLFSNVLDKIDDELKSQSNKERKLSVELISRIASLTYALKPYKYLSNDTIIDKAVSPEKGQLLAALINFELDSATYARIFGLSNFQHSELDSMVIPKAKFHGINLGNSVIRNSNLYNSKFTSANLENVDFEGSYLENVTFEKCDLEGASLKRTFAKKTSFIENIISNTDFTQAILKNSKFNSNRKWHYELGEVIIDNLQPGRFDNLKYLKTIKEFDLLIEKEVSFVLNVTYELDGEQGKTEKRFYHSARRLVSINKNNRDDFKKVNPTEEIWAKITASSFENADLEGASFTNYLLDNTIFENSVLTNVDFQNIILSNSYFNDSKIDSLTFNREFGAQKYSIVPSDFYKFVKHDRHKGITNQFYADSSATAIVINENALEKYPGHLELISSYHKLVKEIDPELLNNNNRQN